MGHHAKAFLGSEGACQLSDSNRMRNPVVCFEESFVSGTQPASPTAAPTGAILVSIFVLAIFLAAIVIAWWSKDSSLQILLGMAGTNAATAVGFWLGSSSGSRDKDQTIAQQAASAAPTPVALSSTTMGTSR